MILKYTILYTEIEIYKQLTIPKSCFLSFMWTTEINTRSHNTNYYTPSQSFAVSVTNIINYMNQPERFCPFCIFISYLFDCIYMLSANHIFTAFFIGANLHSSEVEHMYMTCLFQIWVEHKNRESQNGIYRKMRRKIQNHSFAKS